MSDLDDLHERLKKAEEQLFIMEHKAGLVGRTEEKIRLSGKRQGVKLALSYLEEMQR